MKLILETPALRFLTKKFAEAVQDLDAKIADSSLAPLFGVESKKAIITSPYHTRDIRPFLNKDLIKKMVAVSMKFEATRRDRSSLARAAYDEDEYALEKVMKNYSNSFLEKPKTSNFRKDFQALTC